ncbi:MAG: hypothetical protein H6702_14470 [Myxococcales bacterium]|nr:hypothetical protein [Myxococcales bacterium]
MKSITALFAFALIGLLAGAAHAEKIENVTVKNCTDAKVKICWFNAKDGAKYFARYEWKIAAGESLTLEGKSNGKHAKLFVAPGGDDCNEWSIGAKKQFRKAKTGDSFVAKTSKAFGNKRRLHRGTSCD